MIIRPAAPGDIPHIMELVAALVPLMHAAGNFQWDNEYPNPEVFGRDIDLGQLWVADIGGDIGGVIAITTDQDTEYADAGLDISEEAIVVHRLAVHPGFQGRGVAKALMNKAEETGRERGIASVRVDTNSENAATQRLFPQLGYRFAGEIGLHGRGELRFYCYEKRLV